jgi:hypothetical protein
MASHDWTSTHTTDPGPLEYQDTGGNGRPWAASHDPGSLTDQAERQRDVAEAHWSSG